MCRILKAIMYVEEEEGLHKNTGQNTVHESNNGTGKTPIISNIDQHHPRIPGKGEITKLPTNKNNK